MKKQFFLMLLFCIGLISCSNTNEEPKAEDQTTPINSLENYRFWGDAHNALLEATVNNYGIRTRVVGDEDAHPSYDELNQLQLQYALALDMDENYKPVLCQGLTQFKAYYDTDQLYNDYFVKKNGSYPIVDEFKELRNNGIIDGFEFTYIKELCEVIAQYKQGIVSLTFLDNEIKMIDGKWAEHYQDVGTPQGQTLAYVLCIASSSVEWWSEQEVHTRVVPAWVAADVGGALVGAAIEGGTQFIKFNRVTSWTNVGCKALGGAVVASTGIAGKIGKWLFRL
ncbi:MAG: hypothetical protein K2M56_10700 [Muribaculaceae bacterium]|nr:hypothetical protein [Muribaculaceae bacterium]